MGPIPCSDCSVNSTLDNRPKRNTKPSTSDKKIQKTHPNLLRGKGDDMVGLGGAVFTEGLGLGYKAEIFCRAVVYL